MLEANHLAAFSGAGIGSEPGLTNLGGPLGVWTRQAKGLPEISERDALDNSHIYLQGTSRTWGSVPGNLSPIKQVVA